MIGRAEEPDPAPVGCMVTQLHLPSSRTNYKEEG